MILQSCPIMISGSYLRQLSPSITTCYAPHFAASQNKMAPVMEYTPRHINLPPYPCYRVRPHICPVPLTLVRESPSGLLRDFLTFAPSIESSNHQNASA